MSSPSTDAQPKPNTQRAGGVLLGLSGPDGVLCARCSSLRLVIDKFLPPEATDSALPGFLGTGVDSVGLNRLDFGYLDVIYMGRHVCPFCWLLFEATHASGGSGGSGIELDGLTSDEAACYARSTGSWTAGSSETGSSH